MEKGQAEKFVFDLLRLMLGKKASDMFITAGFPPAMKIDGKMTPISQQVLSPQQAREIARSIMNDKQTAEFDASNECNFAIGIPGVARFRVNAFVQRGSVGLVFRTITTKIPKLEELGLPEVLKDIAMTKRGLVIFVGGTGSGKSTSLAAMVGYRNENSFGHIITIEDPVEFIHEHNNCIITQREIGVDTDSWHIALKNTLRQAPDVILIGEIRDRETMSSAIAYAQTGHLCLATMHANNSYQALNRILSFYPVEVRPTMLGDLAAAMKAIVSQRLLRTVAGGRTPAVEIMLNTTLIAELIEKGDFSGVKQAMENSMAEGSQTFELDIARMIADNIVTRKEGMLHADSPTNLMWRLENDFHAAKAAAEPEEAVDDEPSFTEITLDVKH